MPNQELRLTAVFAALADATRRAVVQRLCEGPAATLELAKPFRMALPSFTQHLGVLEKAGIVKSRKKGRVRTYELVPKQLGAAEHWMSAQREMWEKRLDRLDDYLMKLKEQE